MKKKGFSAEQIIGKLRKRKALLSEGSTVNLPIRSQPDSACHVEGSFLRVMRHNANNPGGILDIVVAHTGIRISKTTVTP